MFNLRSPFTITLAQERAVAEIAGRFQQGDLRQVLLGVTGSGKTFVMAHLIERLGLPALILSPNKTLAAQLYQEFRDFFPESRVGYFISYYDYFQPEAYVPQRNLYISKEVSINAELERLRIAATRNILESSHSITVASVSSIYNIGSPDDFRTQKLSFFLHTQVDREDLMREFVNLGYSRTSGLLERGEFRVRGERLEIHPTSEENPVRFSLKKDNLERLDVIDGLTGETLAPLDRVGIYPTSNFFFDPGRLSEAIGRMRNELKGRIAHFLQAGQPQFAERLEGRVGYDAELLEQFGYCPGIENYSLYLSDRDWGDPPYTLLDFFPGPFLTIVDESHITVPQLNAMHSGDRSRKQKLVDFGFRLPSALENRPLRFDEIQAKLGQTLYVSATPNTFEIEDSRKLVTELLVRPTGLLDPGIALRKVADPIKDLLAEIGRVVPKHRVLVTTLTKKMAERLSDHLAEKGIRCTYLHSEIKALDRIRVIQKLRQGEIDVLVGINLLREGLDLPEVALVAILDADKEGFLRSETALVQTFGRASRNIDGRVLLYIDHMTDSLRRAIGESERRRQQQVEYNASHGISPASIDRPVKRFHDDDYWIRQSKDVTLVDFKSAAALKREIDKLTGQMIKRADALDFKAAALLRDRIHLLKNRLLDWT